MTGESSDVNRLYLAIERVHARIDAVATREEVQALKGDVSRLSSGFTQLSVRLARCTPVEHEKRIAKVEIVAASVAPAVRSLDRLRLRFVVVSVVEFVAIAVVASVVYQLASR